MRYYIEGIEFERINFFGMVEEILNNPTQQYKYFHICIKSINICVTVRTGSSMSEIITFTQFTFGYVTIRIQTEIRFRNLIKTLYKEIQYDIIVFTRTNVRKE